jgi:Raf kinase inhibitor-like YbhB/YbcL family protein
MRTVLVLAALALASPTLAAEKRAGGGGNGKFALKSADVKPNSMLGEQQVFNGFGCSGANVSPQLSWTDPPAGTKSFVLTVYDPDAPTGSGWWHWVVYDIPATAKELPQGAGSGKAALPEGAKQARTDFGAPGFGGACPPPGDKPHRYIFTLHALKADKLDVPADASPALIGFMTRANALGSATFTAKYARKK